MVKRLPVTEKIAGSSPVVRANVRNKERPLNRAASLVQMSCILNAMKKKLLGVFASVLVCGIGYVLYLTYLPVGLGDRHAQIAIPNANFIGTTTFEAIWEDNSGEISDSIEYRLRLNSGGIGFLDADGYQAYWRLKVHAIPNSSSSIKVIYDGTYTDPQDKDFESQNLFTDQESLFGVDLMNGVYVFRKINENFEVEDGTTGIHS